MKRGFFVVLYSSNNLGKSSQIDLLGEKWEEMGLPYKKIKYPIYDLEPTGPLINSVLREGVEMSEADLQKEFAQNRIDFEPQLKKWLKEGYWVFAEDYNDQAYAITDSILIYLLAEPHQKYRPSGHSHNSHKHSGSLHPRVGQPSAAQHLHKHHRLKYANRYS